MDGQDTGTQSMWNEQQLFSRLFFGLTFRCRHAQSNNDVLSWKNNIEAKISMVMGIINDKEKETLMKLRKDINKKYLNYIRTPEASLKLRGQRIYLLNDALFLSESEIDTISNKHMPFLKLKPEIDIDAW